jgi:threonine dehydrogenase-like Zn-dependent dehydrogenase
MRALLYDGPERPLREVDRPIPVGGPGRLVVDVAYAGICGSDLHATEPGPLALPGGVMLGHEFAGTVRTSGDPAWRPGDRITALPLEACATCATAGSSGSCRDGLGILCPQIRIVGLAPDAPGAYAEQVEIAASQAVRLPDGLPLDVAALTEPMAVGAHAVRMAGPLLGARVLVVGAGPIGLAVAAFARMAGVRRLVVSEIDEARRNRAEQLGAGTSIDPGREDVASAFTAHAGGPPDVVFECVGAPGVLARCFALAGVRGRVVVVGVCRREDAILPRVAIRKELTVQFVLGYVREDFDLALEWLSADVARAESLITARASFAELPGLFEALRRPSAHAKVLLDPSR